MSHSRLTSQILQTIGSRSLSTAGRAVCFLLAVRILEPSDYGFFSLFQTSILLGTVVGTLNLQSYIIRALPGLTADRQDMIFRTLASAVLAANLVVALIAGIAVTVGMPVLDRSAVVLMAAIYCCEIASVLVENFFLGCQDFPRANLLVVLRTTVMAVLLAAIYFWEVGGLRSVFLCWLAADILAMTVLARRPIGALRVGLHKTAEPVWKDALRYTAPLLLASVAFYLMKSVDRFVIAHFLGLSSVAFYDIAYKAVNSFYGLTVLAVNAVMVPGVMAAENTGDALGRDRQMMRAAKLATYALTCCGLACLLAPRSLWVMATGRPDYAYAGPLAALLSLGLLFGALGVPAHWTLLARRKTTVVAAADIVGLVANLVLNLSLIPRIGPVGAAMSFVASFALAASLKHFYVRRCGLLKIEQVLSFDEERQLIAHLRPGRWLAGRG